MAGIERSFRWAKTALNGASHDLHLFFRVNIQLCHSGEVAGCFDQGAFSFNFWRCDRASGNKVDFSIFELHFRCRFKAIDIDNTSDHLICYTQFEQYFLTCFDLARLLYESFLKRFINGKRNQIVTLEIECDEFSA